MTQTRPDWSRFVEIVRDSRRVVLTAHLRPDGDCIGSEIAMALILETLGKEVLIVNPHRTPPPLKAIDQTARIRPLEDITTADRAWIDSADLLIILDTRSWQQLGNMENIIRNFSGKKVIVDHHEFGQEIAHEEFIETTAEATGRLVFEAAAALKVPLTREIAEAICAAIATDTGWFRFAAVNAETFRIIASLIDVGVNMAERYRVLYEQESLGRMFLIGRTLAKLEAHLGGRLMVAAITLDDLRISGALPSDTEDIVNHTLRVRGSDVAVIFVEQRDGSHKVSFRSRCQIDCSQLAKRFGGGGHRAASGALLKMNLPEARKAVIAAIEEMIAEQK